MHLNAKVHLNLFRRDDERLQATGAELGDSIFNTTGENWLYMKQLKGYEKVYMLCSLDFRSFTKDVF